MFGLKETQDTYDAQGLTEHVGCPVWQGQKWITTMRLHEITRAKELHSKHDYYIAPAHQTSELVMLKGSDVMWKDEL